MNKFEPGTMEFLKVSNDENQIQFADGFDILSTLSPRSYNQWTILVDSETEIMPISTVESDIEENPLVWITSIVGLFIAVIQFLLSLFIV